MNAPLPFNKTFELKYQGTVYAISIKLSSGCIIINIAKEETIPRKQFELKVTLAELEKKSKMFNCYETIEEVVSEFNSIFQENKFKLQEDNDKIMLYLFFVITLRKTNEICFEIPQLEVQKDDLLLDVCHSFNQMKITLSSFGERLTNLENDFKEIKQKEKGVIEMLDQDFQGVIESTISKSKIKFKLIYRATTDGDSAQAFHSYCDGRFPTIVVVKTTNDVVFGGYASIPWDSSGAYKLDTKAFIFSNNLKKIYQLKASNPQPIYCHPSYGPTFGGGHDIYIASSFLTSTANYVNANSYANNSGYEINNNERTFKVKELEVYKLKYYSK